MPNKDFTRSVPIAVPHRSGFDKSFRNLFTAKCGTLVPIFCDEVIPNTTVHLDLALSAQLPPLASETFMNCDYKVEAFFCPTRLLFAGFEQWVTGNDKYTSGNTSDYIRVPVFTATPTSCAPGTLLDYLGVMISGSETGQGDFVNALPMLCYHRIWDDWYRSSLVQRSIYTDQIEYYMANGDVDAPFGPETSKWAMPFEGTNGTGFILTQNDYFADNVKLMDLRQRNFGLDYFTMATPSAQNGDAQKVSMALPNPLSYNFINSSNPIGSSPNLAVRAHDTNYTGSDAGSISFGSSAPTVQFTISSLRAANSIQQFLERNNLIGNRLVDYVKGQYGANLKDSIAQRPVYLGSYSTPVYSKGVYQSNQETSNDVASTNPFNSVGARYGHGYAEGTGSLVDFTAEEPGYIMLLGSLVPEVTYATGVEKYMQRYVQRSSQSDMANPILQNVGNQPVFESELCSAYLFDRNINDNVFGYVERYADWKTRNNQLHGLLRDGLSLEAFALQRSFAPPANSGTHISINSDFLRIPTTYMDQVSAVASAISSYGVWVDCYFKYSVSMPLYQYSLPSLQDPAWEHGDVFKIPRGGIRID